MVCDGLVIYCHLEKFKGNRLPNIGIILRNILKHTTRSSKCIYIFPLLYIPPYLQGHLYLPADIDIETEIEQILSLKFIRNKLTHEVA